LAALLALAGPASSKPGPQRLGEDPVLDAPAALDITYLDVQKVAADLEIRIGINGMLPGIGGYPTLPGIEWLFTTGTRTFLAEAYVDNTQGAYLLFEKVGDTYELLGELEGTYDFADGFVSILVPLKEIGAKKGSRIGGVGEDDVDSHVHHADTTYTDTMTTTGSFTVR
jgi:hypothetical protein